MTNVSKQSLIVVCRPQDLLSCQLGNEEVILDSSSGIYYGLDEVGAKIWRLIQTPKTVAAIHDAVLEEYEVDPDQCYQDVADLLRDLIKHDLAKVARDVDA